MEREREIETNIEAQRLRGTGKQGDTERLRETHDRDTERQRERDTERHREKQNRKTQIEGQRDAGALAETGR